MKPGTRWTAVLALPILLLPCNSRAASGPPLDCPGNAPDCMLVLTVVEQDGCRVLIPASAMIVRRRNDHSQRPVRWVIDTRGYRFKDCRTGSPTEACGIEIVRNADVNGSPAFVQRQATGPRGYQWISTGVRTLPETDPNAPAFIAHVVRDSGAPGECVEDPPIVNRD